MKEPDGEGLASRTDPESCSVGRKAGDEALTGAHAGRVFDGNQVFDMTAPEEEPLGDHGSSCNYPGVMIQVMPFLQSTIDAARKRGRLETVSGVGDEAWLYENPAGHAELYVRIDKRFPTLQRDIGMGQTLASVRPGVIALANALVAKLR